ncbi:MAG: nucleotide exchange factor GrpE [Kiritimatiellae bacterium]|nr:nucleotide exchange factor GrpE [Kiritimatiellia bacterium]
MKETKMDTDKETKSEAKTPEAEAVENAAPAQPEDTHAADQNVAKPTEETQVEAESAKSAEDKSAEDKQTEDNTATENRPAENKPTEAPAQPDWKDRYARTMADFDNFRKRTERDREDLVKFAASDVIKAMLPTVDNLSLALEKAKDKADDPFVAGVKLVYDGLVKALADQGATPLDSVGEPFDANFHDALAQLPSPDVEEGVVMNEVKRGWLLHGKLLRPAQVVVSAGKGA